MAGRSQAQRHEYQPSLQDGTSATPTRTTAAPSGKRTYGILAAATANNVYTSVAPNSGLAYIPSPSVSGSNTVTTYTYTISTTAAGQGTYYAYDANGNNTTRIQLTAGTKAVNATNYPNIAFQPAANFVGNITFTYTVTDNTGAVSNVASYNIAVTNTTAKAQTSQILLSTFGATRLSLPLAGTPATNNTIQNYIINTLPDASAGILSLNGMAVTAGQTIALADVNNLFFAPVAGFFGTAVFNYAAKDNTGAAAPAGYGIPVSLGTCGTGTGQRSLIDFTSRAIGESFSTTNTITVDGVTVVASPGAYPFTNSSATTSSLDVQDLNGLPGKGIAWQEDYDNTTGNTKTSTVTFTFSKPLTNFTLTVGDLDRNFSTAANQGYIDQMTFDGYDANGNKITLPAANVSNGSATTYSGSNVVTATDNSTSNPADNVVITFPQAITRLTLTYKNIVNATDAGFQFVVIPQFSWCSQAEVQTTISGPTTAVTGQTVYYYASTTNTGPATATNDVVTLNLSSKPAANAVTVTNGTYNASTGIVTFNPADIASGATVTNLVSYVATATTMGTAASTSNAYDANAADNNGSAASAQVTTTVSPTGAAGTAANCATAGRDGAASLATNPNTYYPSNGTQSLMGGTSTTITVGAARGAGTTIAAGDLLLVVQMQGADINFTDSDSYGDGLAGGSANGTSVTNNFTAGTYEYVTVASVSAGFSATTGGTITLATALRNSYSNAVATASTGQRTFQVIRVPQYTNAALTANLVPAPWNGTTGGIVALDVDGQLNLNGFTIDASGMGFRGGAGRKLNGTGTGTTPSTTTYRSSAGLNTGGTKGEGIAGTPRYVNDPTYAAANNALLDTQSTTTTGYPTLLPATLTDGYPSGDNGRGAPGNAGGGGTDGNPTSNNQNTGGGGGANGGRGGRGGNAWNSNQPVGGEPGAAFPAASSSRLILGGGGGAGTTNDGTGTPSSGFASSGAAGGGAVLVRTGTLTGTGSILANGANANNTVGNDGSGGGGAGGSILVTATYGQTATLTLTANGGTGGTNNGQGTQANPANHGPGGGGGGGVIFTNSVVAATATSNGAANGTTQPGTVAFGAEAGTIGVSNAAISNSIANSLTGATCVADVTTALMGPQTVSPGQPTGTYTATFTNEGPNSASTVTRTVTLPAGATNVVLPTGATLSGSTIDFGTATSLASGASNAFAFSFTPATSASGTVAITSNVMTAASQGTDTAPNTSTINATVAPVVDVTTTIAATTSSVAAGTASGTPKFTVTFSNTVANSTATGIMASVQLPAGLTNVAFPSGTAGSYNATTGLVTYPSVTSLTNGSPVTSVITFDAPATGPVVATSAVTTTTSEAGQTATNKATTSMAITPAFDLTTTLNGPASAVPGSEVTLAVTSTNSGPSAANATETLTLTSGLTNVYVSNGGVYNPATTTQSIVSNGVTYSVPAGSVVFPTIASLPAGQTVANSVSYTQPGTAFSPSAAVSTTTSGETTTANNTAYLNGAATSTLLANATAGAGTANAYTQITTTTPSTTVGGTVALTVTTGNNGPNAATGVQQTVQLLPGLQGSLSIGGSTTSTSSGNVITFTNGSASGTTYNTLTGVVIFPALANGSNGSASATSVSNTITFVAPATIGNNGQLLAMAAVATTNTDPVLADNVASVAITLVQSGDVATSISGPATSLPGQAVQYTASFVNNGPMTATSVVETAQLPAGLGTVSITDPATGTASSGASYNSTTGLVTFPTLTTDLPGASQVFNLSFTAPAQSLRVSSNVAATSADAAPANNSASVATTIGAADLATTVVGPATAAVGNAVTYSVNTTNNGVSTATNTVTTLQLASGFSAATLQVNGQTGTLSNGVITYTFASGATATYNTSSGLVTFPTVANLASGASAANYVTFVMPSPASGQTAGVASASSNLTDPLPTNNTSSVATSVAPTTTTIADITATVSAGSSTATVNSGIVFTASYANNGPDAANVVPTLQLLPGLTTSTLTLGGATASANGSTISFSNGASYNTTTGLLTFATIASQASGAAATTYTVTVTAPANGPVVATAATTSATTEPNTAAAQANDVQSVSVSVTPLFDEITTLAGPASAAVGNAVTYTVTALNNGPSLTSNATTQTVTLPAGVAPLTGSISNGGTYSSTSNTITWTIPAGQGTGTAGAVANSFTLTQPAGGVTVTANVSVSGESNTNNDVAYLNGATSPTATTVANQAPLAFAVVNTLQNAQSNEAGGLATGLLISPLNASDPENSFATAKYTIVSVPTNISGGTTNQGVLYYSSDGTTTGTYSAVVAGQTLTDAQSKTLRFKAAAGFVGNASFTYLTTDAASSTSPVVEYTIPVQPDVDAATYTLTPTKGGTNNPYVVGDVIAFTTDVNGAVNNATTASVYQTNGQLQTGSNITGGIASATAGAFTSTRTGVNSLADLGLTLQPDGRIVVSNPGTISNPNLRSGTYSVSVTTVDANGGVTTQTVTFVIPSNPLPVVLTAFTATTVQNRDAQLAWTTASETNSAYFDVERSFDGASYTTIGQVAAKGTSLVASTYALTDAGVANRATGAVYYRLKQVDLDGKAAYSPVRTVSFTKAASLALSLYPNPAQYATGLDLSQLPATGTYQVQLLDATGRVVRSASLSGGQVQSLDLHELASGTYHVLVTGTRADGSALRQTLRLTKE
ncbi:hypothetical protein GCM10023172_21410 [Hymenobacter ginsengisoli]|uniref:Secretion system C-terminal sorting domain-containing protein n=1 Tax=Hymenobacter ginsengisoli TaxID=1051626 RepID=A0ABP8QD82_9BACT